ncbi:ATP-binding cassette domain-containing protein [Aquibacillus saliphilus]|uniref:ATP-binding cassette domain-containing protein n=1 Tax=Aquibacillus saliphilus TaxID=1909422 RepID=UPI001CEFF581|nr:ABC transporter ATP-binding protein [Aquibacillus saliphilus]
MKIEAKNLSKIYKGKRALDQISFCLEEPKIYGLLGKNGAGKTTFMQLLAGMMQPTSGEILVEKTNPFNNQRLTESICLIKEGNNFKKDLKIKNVLTISSLFYPTWDQLLALKLVDEFSLDINAKVKALSKGMESALGIIVGLASKAPITMFDEPYIGLDASARSRFYEILVEQYQEHKRTIIFSTHLIDEVSLLFEEVLIFQEGKLLVQENTDVLRQKCISISGTIPQIESFITDKMVIDTKQFAGVMTAVVVGIEIEEARTNGFTVEGVTIQQLMIYLTSYKGGKIEW